MKNFGKYNKTWEKVSNRIQKESNRELIYNEKYIKAEQNWTQNKAFITFVNE